MDIWCQTPATCTMEMALPIPEVILKGCKPTEKHCRGAQITWEGCKKNLKPMLYSSPLVKEISEPPFSMYSDSLMG